MDRLHWMLITWVVLLVHHQLRQSGFYEEWCAGMNRLPWWLTVKSWFKRK